MKDSAELVEGGLTRSWRIPLVGVALVRLVAWLAALPHVLIVMLVLSGSPTWSAVAYLAAGTLLLWGMVTLRTSADAPLVFGVRRPRGIVRGAVVGILATMAVRGVSARSGETLHFTPEPRFVARVLDESDVAVSGTRVLVASGLLHDDADELPAAMRAAYAAMRDHQGDAPSPVLATYLGMQSASAFDLLVVEPPPRRPTHEGSGSGPQLAHEPHDAVVFLHGFAGNFALPCWQMARAVAPLGVLTACPSTRWVGDWWSPDGERTLRRTLDVLRDRGVTRVVLAGLSNGGYGASRLAPRMRGSFVGLILISGASPETPATGIPALVLHGRADSMASFSEATSYAARPDVKLVAFDAGHFSMLVRAKEHDAAILSFVASVFPRERTHASRSLRSTQP